MKLRTLRNQLADCPNTLLRGYDLSAFARMLCMEINASVCCASSSHNISATETMTVPFVSIYGMLGKCATNLPNALLLSSVAATSVGQ